MLHWHEARLGPSSNEACAEYQERRRRLAKYIAQLCTTVQLPGGNNLGADTLDRAYALLGAKDMEVAGLDSQVQASAYILAGQVVKSFEALRKYLRESDRSSVHINPHLSENPGLMERLLDWDASLEVGRAYL